ncbi:uncharacterized protein LOC105185154 [Harpegnathos saltator]|uniref:Cupin-like domain-containing protein n=1 Tax=Harpegnathos saltator TaxID=610380 RepID=E2BPJ4_HARSA|nr:uncharacterized protein LOC105185154 [Harpegnathos saltator]EFN82398.1 hypothetical protein EAI_01540 [Harpegnathos saltator]
MAASENDAEFVRKAFLKLTKEFIRRGAATHDLKFVALNASESAKKRALAIPRRAHRKGVLAVLLASFLYSLLCNGYLRFANVTTLTSPLRSLQETRCLLPNNYLVWEFTRPVSNCDYCRDVDAPLILRNLTREEFRAYSYSSRPMIIKNVSYNWPARERFNLRFFRDLYERTEGAYESVEEECQFLRFKSNFANLREVFAMSERRASLRDGENAWYVGWKNCHPRILDAMKPFYSVPPFLPEDAEIPYSNYIFLGYEEGAVMHLDYISRLMWQAQVIGSKTWIVAPTPECDSECKSFEFSVDTADIVLLDTRIWYHSTYVENGEFSLTITSEYG